MLDLRAHWRVGSDRRRRSRSGSSASSGLAAISGRGFWPNDGHPLLGHPRSRHAKSGPCIISMGNALHGLVGSCGQANGGVGWTYFEHLM
jgi:hypothetical protein